MARFEVPSLQMIETAAEGGGADALFELGLMYCVGRGVGTDLVEAHKWFNLAALGGNVEARRYRTEISSEMTRMEIGRAQRAAREWLSRH
jgi:TPR repeat protein